MKRVYRGDSIRERFHRGRSTFRHAMGLKKSFGDDHKVGSDWNFRYTVGSDCTFGHTVCSEKGMGHRVDSETSSYSGVREKLLS